MRGRQFPYKDWVFRSNYEKDQAKRLVKEGILFEYECHIIQYMDNISVGKCNACGSNDVSKPRIYTPDFYFPESNVYVETKGKLDLDGRRKMKQVCLTCDEDVRMVFMRDNWLTKKHKMNYSRWCEINDIQYAIGDIPLEWAIK